MPYVDMLVLGLAAIAVALVPSPSRPFLGIIPWVHVNISMYALGILSLLVAFGAIKLPS